MLLSEIFLKENLQLPNDVIAMIREHCQPYLQAVGNDLSKLMYRGVSINAIQRAEHTPVPYLYIVPGRRTDRRPLDTPIEMHEALNQRFQQKFGVPFRNGLFATGDTNSANEYAQRSHDGAMTAIIPIGDFKYCWSPVVEDLFDVFDEYEPAEDDEDFTDVVDEYQNTDLPQAISSGHEIMLYCDKCFMFTTKP